MTFQESMFRSYLQSDACKSGIFFLDGIFIPSYNYTCDVVERRVLIGGRTRGQQKNEN